MSVWVGLQSRRWTLLCACVSVYCFSCGSDALVSRSMSWHHETLRVCLLRWHGTSAWNGESIRKKPREEHHLVLGILHRLSILKAAITLFLILLFLLLTDKKLLRRPAKLPTFNFSLRRLNHDGWKSVFELTASIEVWGVGENLQNTRGTCWLLIFH